MPTPFEQKILDKAMEEEKEAHQEQKPFLTGQPIPWSEITEEDNKKDWIWENYIARGYITLLSALWKAGKSTLLRCLFLAMAEEEEFAGQPTKAAKVLVLSEESKGDWSDKKEDLEAKLTENILIWVRPIRVKPNLKQWTQFIEEITQRCLNEDIQLVVVDTLSTFWPIDNENDSAQVLKALVPLYNFTENNIAVLLVHHFRKGGGDQAQASRGSGALPGFVDNIIEFTRNEDGGMYKRILKTYGRFDKVIPRVDIELQADGKYHTVYGLSKKDRIEKIMSIFREHPNMALSTIDIYNFYILGDGDEKNKISDRTIREYVAELRNKNILKEWEKRLVKTKMTSFYVIAGEYSEQRNMGYPLPVDPLRSAPKGTEQPTKPSSAATPQVEAKGAERNGTSPNENENPPDWEEPPKIQ